MARPLRIALPGAPYHVTLRGDGREDIYRGDTDRQALLAVFGEVCERFNWWAHAYCLGCVDVSWQGYWQDSIACP